MIQAKLDICFAFTNYAGNGGIASTIPYLRRWWAKEFHKLCMDERIGRIADLSESAVSDTPITMTRNLCLRQAKENGFDVLVFIDSDNLPDLYSEDPRALPFIESSLDFLYKRLINGIPTIIAAPYCGPPPHPTSGGEENVYVFKWESRATDSVQETRGARLIAYGRDEAALLRGIQPAAALPTGVCMIALKILDDFPPPYFRYEWKDGWECQKVTTEDVFFTRNAAMAGAHVYGDPICYCNWDAWAGHYKQKVVGRPEQLRVEDVCEMYADAVRKNVSRGDEIRYVGFKPDGSMDLPPSHMAAMEEQANMSQEGRELAEIGIDCEPKEMTLANGEKHVAIGWLTKEADIKVLLRELTERFGDNPAMGVEVGSWTGYSATRMLDALPELTLFCVDTWEGSSNADVTGAIVRRARELTGNPNIIRDTFNANTERFGNRICAGEGDSLVEADMFDRYSLDFVFIDAGHTYEECRADIEAWLPKIKPGGLIIGHDYNENFPGVIHAANELNDLGLVVLHEESVWWAATSFYMPERSNTEPVAEDHVITPGKVRGKYVEYDETLVSPIQRKALVQFLADKLEGDFPPKAVYIGSPDPGTLAMISGGECYCVVRRDDPRLDYARRILSENDWDVRFVLVDNYDGQEAFWNDGDSDLVVLHRSAYRQCDKEMPPWPLLLDSNGWVCVLTADGEVDCAPRSVLEGPEVPTEESEAA